MFPYRVKYADSETDIQINDLLYNLHPTCQNTFDFLENLKKQKTLFCILYKLHNLYSVIFVNFVMLGFLYFIFIYILHV